jgi:hypothetical protein
MNASHRTNAVVYLVLGLFCSVLLLQIARLMLPWLLG